MYALENSTWGGIVSGEWWLTADGDAIFADQDIGDQGHEVIAIDYLLDKDVLIDGLEQYGQLSKKDADWHRMSDEYGASSLYYEFVIDDDLGIEASSPSIWRDLQKHDPRIAFMKHQSAIMVIGTAFAAWRVTERTIRAIQDFVLQETDGEPAPDMDITIERIMPPRKSTFADWVEFQFVRKPGELVWS
jgi:hypothetical protein